ncbi:hypothetical protein NE237_024484 [Protea cynaroides]|uniref:Uncharacterized protein n=1 Tax=Protea cynaroides TaxID=273540 RepID=A0A9Q0H0N6_9MAGN|nr:hypothetical protein NE237_024484 [Protea cynaroides]
MAQDGTRRPLKIITGAAASGSDLKDALVAHLRSLDIEVEDIGTGKYYSIGEEVGRRVSSAVTSSDTDSTETRGLVACGTGVGVSIFANKFPGVYASTCVTVSEARNARSINNCNVLAVSGTNTTPETGLEILNTWLETPFKSPCPASGNNPWPQGMATFLDESIPEMLKIGSVEPEKQDTCAICCLAKNREFSAVDIMPGGSMKIVRESPTSAIVRFKAGSVEPAHHYTFGHDLIVLKGSKRVWNVSKGEKYDLSVGDYLLTPAGDVHRVKYFEDTEFFIRWDGRWDIFLNEDADAAIAAIEKDS